LTDGISEDVEVATRARVLLAAFMKNQR